MEALQWINLKRALQKGLLAGLIALMIALVGLVEAFRNSSIIKGLFTLGDLLLFSSVIAITYSSIQKEKNQSKTYLALFSSAIGLAAGLVLSVLLIIGTLVDMRPMFINASAALFSLIMRGQSFPVGLVFALLQSIGVALLVVLFYHIPDKFRKPLTQGLIWVVLVGMLRNQILLARIAQIDGISWFLRRVLFAQSGLSFLGAAFLLVLITGIYYFQSSRKKTEEKKLPPAIEKRNRFIRLGIGLVILALLPPMLGVFFSEILDTSGYFILMGLGLNIVVGFAGLLDLGYVAFYAIGAYTMGVLTSTGLGFFSLNYWVAMLIALGIAVIAGVILGLPVLRLRGDYLAIVTLGFGEIVRLLVLSDWLKPWLGGTQGIQRIAQPSIFGLKIDTLQELYYLIILGVFLAAFVASRLKESRLGRAWMAIREDEDVAQAMGINLVVTKLTAFATGALFAGLAGTFGAAKLTSVYPHSMTFIVSINVLVLIIIGGMGSIPGVIVGGLVLVGLPGLLTEFEEYKFWFYGVVLVVMMLNRPEGLIPEARRKLELHEGKEEELEIEPASAPEKA